MSSPDPPNPPGNGGKKLVGLTIQKKDGTAIEVGKKRERPPVTMQVQTPVDTEPPPQAEVQRSPSTDSAFKIERRSESTSTLSIEGRRVTYFQHTWSKYIAAHCKEASEAGGQNKGKRVIVKEPWERSTQRGVVTLRTLLMEMSGAAPSSSSIGRRPNRGPGGEAQLVTVSEQAFVSSSQRKQVGMWDAASVDSFRENLNQAINRLTVQNLGETVSAISEFVEEGLDKKKPDYNEQIKQRRDVMAEVIVENACLAYNNTAFSIMYGEFTKELAGLKQDFFTGVVKEVVSREFAKFDDWLLNVGDTEYDEQRCIGYAQFYGSLARAGLIEPKVMVSAMGKILKELGVESPHPHRVMMLDAFVKGLEQKVTLVTDEVWKNIDRLVERDDIPNRIHFILKDISDARTGGRRTGSEKVEESRLEKFVRTIRGSYSEYCEDDSTLPEVDLDLDGFVQAAMEFMTTLSFNDVYFYASFVSGVALKKQQQQRGQGRNRLADAMIRMIDQFAKNSLVTDVPQVWQMVTILLCEFMIKGVIDVPTAQRIHYQYSQDWDPLNDLKYFLYDYHDFAAPITVGGQFPFPEISDALAIPNKLTSPPGSLRMSRLIATAIVRSVFVQLPFESCQLDELGKFKEILKMTSQKQPKAFNEAVADEFKAEGRFKFTEQDLAKFLA